MWGKFLEKRDYAEIIIIIIKAQKSAQRCH